MREHETLELLRNLAVEARVIRLQSGTRRALAVRLAARAAHAKALCDAAAAARDESALEAAVAAASALPIQLAWARSAQELLVRLRTEKRVREAMARLVGGDADAVFAELSVVLEEADGLGRPFTDTLDDATLERARRMVYIVAGRREARALIRQIIDKDALERGLDLARELEIWDGSSVETAVAQEDREALKVARMALRRIVQEEVLLAELRHALLETGAPARSQKGPSWLAVAQAASTSGGGRGGFLFTSGLVGLHPEAAWGCPPPHTREGRPIPSAGEATHPLISRPSRPVVRRARASRCPAVGRRAPAAAGPLPPLAARHAALALRGLRRAHRRRPLPAGASAPPFGCFCPSLWVLLPLPVGAYAPPTADGLFLQEAARAVLALRSAVLAAGDGDWSDGEALAVEEALTTSRDLHARVPELAAAWREAALRAETRDVAEQLQQATQVLLPLPSPFGCSCP